MLTQMGDEDWTIVLEVFRGCLSRRGDKARDDRRFLGALHFFTLQNVSWRALPAEYGPWNTVWKRFSRLSRSGVFEAFLQAPAELAESALGADVRQHHGARPCLGRGRKRGQHNQDLGRSRGGFSTKIHFKTDFDGHPLAFHLTGGEANDSPQFPLLLGLGPDIKPRAVLTNTGYDAKSDRGAARALGITPIIPVRTITIHRPKHVPRRLYKARARIEQAVGKLKRFKRIVILAKSVHRI